MSDRDRHWQQYEEAERTIKELQANLEASEEKVRVIEDGYAAMEDRAMQITEAGAKVAMKFLQTKAQNMELKARLERAEEPIKSEPGHIDIVFERPVVDRGSDGLRFVEVEAPDGRSVNVGEWLDDPRGFRVLRIPAQGSMVTA